MQLLCAFCFPLSMDVRRQEAGEVQLIVHVRITAKCKAFWGRTPQTQQEKSTEPTEAKAHTVNYNTC